MAERLTPFGFMLLSTVIAQSKEFEWLAYEAERIVTRLCADEHVV
jgi:hypothetical protein